LRVRFDADGKVDYARVPGYVEPGPYLFFVGTDAPVAPSQ
jgi:hypothetical protein